MKCPKCGREMVMGATHSEEYPIQWECHYCQVIVNSEHKEPTND